MSEEKKSLFIEGHEPLEVVIYKKNKKDGKSKELLSHRELSQYITTLSPAQLEAKKKIEEYWKERRKRYKNWKFQKYWSLGKPESISTRVDDWLYNELKNQDTSKIIQNFIRHFLRHKHFRKKFMKVLYIQFQKEIPIPLKKYSIDISELFENLLKFYPNTVSAKVYPMEKELLFFYFTFLSNFSVSYALRVALIHFRYESLQEPIQEDYEVFLLLSKMIEEVKFKNKPF